MLLDICFVFVIDEKSPVLNRRGGTFLIYKATHVNICILCRYI